MTFFKPSGKYYMEEYFKLPDNIYDWDIPKELKKIKRFRKLIGSSDDPGFTATGIFTNEVSFMISPYNF